MKKNVTELIDKVDLFSDSRRLSIQLRRINENINNLEDHQASSDAVEVASYYLEQSRENLEGMWNLLMHFVHFNKNMNEFDYQDFYIVDLKLSKRVETALIADGLFKIGDIEILLKNRLLYRVPNLGDKSIEEIRVGLMKFKLDIINNKGK